MVSRNNYYLFLFTISLFAAGCANRVAPQGGPSDETPPGIDTLRSTPGFQTNFNPQRIEITFDEWVKLEDVFNQVVVSPPLNIAPEITLHGKTVRVTFDKTEVLKPDVTYTINFGSAVRDLTENNPAKDLRFVFSTGDFIDSLRIQAGIFDAFTGDPVENVLFMLYDNLTDTVVSTQRPFYFGKSDKEGRVAISNIKSGTFKVFALADGNLNYLFDSESEKTAFLDPVVLPDSNLNSLNFRLFESVRRQRLMDRVTAEFGHARLVFSRRPDEDMSIRFFDIDRVWQEIEGDTLHLWHNATTPWTAMVTTPGKLAGDAAITDTVYIKAVDNTSFLANAGLSLSGKGGAANGRGKFAGGNSVSSGAVQIQHPLKSATLRFNHPIQRIDTAFIRLSEDTTNIPIAFRVEQDSSSIRAFRIVYPWKEGKVYRLNILPGAVTDIYGFTNDTIAQQYNVQLLKTYGNVRIKADGLDTAMQYIFQLMINEKVEAERIVAGKATYEDLVEALPPGSYALRVIEDNNRNERWNTGDYLAHRQPERILNRKIKELLRPDWELEVAVTWK